MKKKYLYYKSCVDFTPTEANRPHGLLEMIDKNLEITRRTFVKHVNPHDLESLEEQLGYERYSKRGLTMAKDGHVSYHRSVLNNQTVYYLRQSAIEYIFVRDTTACKVSLHRV